MPAGGFGREAQACHRKGVRSCNPAFHFPVCWIARSDPVYMGWTETASETFLARHDERDASDAGRVLAQLEYGRERLERQLEVELGELAVVLHGSPAQLDAAQPWIALQRRLTAPAARRYVVGWAGERELHVLSPRLLAQRA